MKLEERESRVLTRFWLRVVITWLVWVVAVIAGGITVWQRFSGGVSGEALGGGGLRVERADVDHFREELAARRAVRGGNLGSDPFVLP